MAFNDGADHAAARMAAATGAARPMTLATYITHPQVVMDPDVPVTDWGLSPLGRARAERLAASPWARGLARVVASTERKAQETAAILAVAAGVAPET